MARKGEQSSQLCSSSLTQRPKRLEVSAESNQAAPDHPSGCGWRSKSRTTNRGTRSRQEVKNWQSIQRLWSQQVTRTRNSMESALTDDRRNMLKRSGDVYSVGIAAGGPPTSVFTGKHK